jgi:hypothetical protein
MATFQIATDAARGENEVTRYPSGAPLSTAGRCAKAARSVGSVAPKLLRTCDAADGAATLLTALSKRARSVSAETVRR